MTSWGRRVPAPLWLACGLVIAIRLVDFCNLLALDGNARYGGFTGEGWRNATSGTAVMFNVLLLVGVWWLAGRLTGAAAVGAKIAIASIAVRIAVTLGWVAWEVHFVLHLPERTELAEQALHLIASVGGIGFAVGLGLAARRWWAIVLGAVLGLLTSPPWFLGELYTAHVHTIRGQFLVLQGVSIGWDLTVLALVLLACRNTDGEASGPGSAPGLRRIAFALHGRAVAGVILACLGLLFVSPADLQSIVELATLVRIAAAAVEAGLLVVLALGALAAVRGRTELPTWPMVLSAAAALWVTDVLLQRIAGLYVALHPASWPNSQRPDVFVHVSMATTALVAAGAVTSVLISLAIAARRRGLDELHRKLVARTGWFVGLALVATATAAWLGGPFAETAAAALLWFGASLMTVAALWVAASACSEAAGALASEPGLPAARVIRS